MNKNFDDPQVNIKISIGAQGGVTQADIVYNIGHTDGRKDQKPERLLDVIKEGSIEALKVQHSVLAVLIEMLRAWRRWARKQ